MQNKRLFLKMNSTLKIAVSVLSIAAILFSSGCASNEAKPPSSADRYSSMPQNMPQGWEGQSALGGMGGYNSY